jgi:hypothetical protein
MLTHNFIYCCQDFGIKSCQNGTSSQVFTTHSQQVNIADGETTISCWASYEYWSDTL